MIPFDIKISDDISAVFISDSSSLFNDNDLLDPIHVGKYYVAPWGVDNNLPEEILKKIESSEIVAANANFNRNVAFGLGPKIGKVVRDENQKIIDYVEVHDGPEYEWFERNDISMCILELLTDMNYFENAFLEFIPDKQFKEIYNVRHLESTFSRWGVNQNGEIISHLYSNQWSKGATEKQIISSYVVDEFNAVNYIQRKLTQKCKRLVYPIYMPCPGRPYYSIPSWYSIFKSGWYDQSVAIPMVKKAILENNLGIKHVIYISKKYWEVRYKEEGINPSDIKAAKEFRNKEVQRMSEFLSGGKNAAKAMVVTKEMLGAGTSTAVEKYIEIVPVENQIKGGEYVSDTETSANIICYAMGVHPSLIGATPGKSSGSMSGTDKRELFLIKQSLLKAMVDRTIRPFNSIKKINKWDDDIMIMLPEYIFTTLDLAKSGKVESTNNAV